jgi:hypothetical protein
VRAQRCVPSVTRRVHAHVDPAVAAIGYYDAALQLFAHHFALEENLMMSLTLSHGHWQETVSVGDRVVRLPGHDGNWNLSPIYGLVFLNREDQLCVREDERFGGTVCYLTSAYRKVGDY